MNVRYAILQRSLDVPAAKKLQCALRAPGGLAPADAAGLAGNANGILVRGSYAEDSLSLRQAPADDLETGAGC